MIKLLLVSAGATLFGIITAAILLNLAMGCGTRMRLRRNGNWKSVRPGGFLLAFF